MQNFLDGLVRSTKTVMTRAELGGTLFLVAVIGVLLTSREEGGKSDKAESRRSAQGLFTQPRRRGFCELPLYGVLRSSPNPRSANFALTEFSEVFRLTARRPS